MEVAPLGRGVASRPGHLTSAAGVSRMSCMAFELTTRFIAQSASSEEEARAELALFLVNTPANLVADAAQCDELEMAGPDLEWPDFR